MKEFKSEFAHSYKTYSFGYTNYALQEKGDNLSEIYKLGYLPYSGSENIKDILYMCRSARLNLKKFKLSSENRRIARKFDGGFDKKIIPTDKFKVDTKFIKFCTDYFEKRHGPNIMPKKRLLTIINSGFLTNIVEYRKNGKIVAYVFMANDKNISHYWYSFYDLDLVFKSLGLWIMIDAVREAKRKKKSHFYLGTVYGEKALYKTNFNNLEYWDGNNWVEDRKKLRKKSHSDEDKEVHITDEWKEDKELF